MKPLSDLRQPAGIPAGIVLESPGRNLDSLVQTAATEQLKQTLIREWHIRDAFDDVAEFGIKPTTMSLFFGPPGNGKTMAAKMLASVTESPLYRVDCGGLLNSYMGESEKNMRRILDYLQAAGQAIVLFDECEALFRSRESGGTGISQEITRVMQLFWQALDRWEAPQMFLLATNRLQDLDEALLSRCEVQLEFTGPTVEQANKVLEYWAETLHEHGADVWKPVIQKQIKRQPPVSFRALWQMISASVRQWIVANN